MQGNDFVQSNMCHRTLRCFDCHQVHSDTPSLLPLAGNKLCLSCHDATNPSGFRGTVAEHTHPSEGSTGSQCVACHMPKIGTTIRTTSSRPTPSTSFHRWSLSSPASPTRNVLPHG